MGSLLSILGSPVSDLITNVGNLVRSFVTTDADRLKATQALTELQANLQMKLAGRGHRLGEGAGGGGDGGSAIAILARAQLAADCDARIRVHHRLELHHRAGVHRSRSLPIPADMWELIKIGMGGYIIGRSAEKVVPGIVAAVQQAKAPAGDKSVPK